jgi:hypothetical protein
LKASNFIKAFSSASSTSDLINNLIFPPLFILNRNPNSVATNSFPSNDPTLLEVATNQTQDELARTSRSAFGTELDLNLLAGDALSNLTPEAIKSAAKKTYESQRNRKPMEQTQTARAKKRR